MEREPSFGRDEWKRAVVHLEGAADSLSFDEQIDRMNAIQEALSQRNANPDELLREWPPSRDLRFRGTAIFLRDGGRRYLVTARHVLTDEDSARRAQPTRLMRMMHEDEERIRDWIFPIIFRVPTLTEVLARSFDVDRALLMNLGAGPNWMVPYTFSDPPTDLAVISLDKRDRRFADGLEDAGYIPVDSAAFGDEPSEEGAEIFSVGYPDAVAILTQRDMDPSVAHWSSSAVSAPAFSFGRVAMLDPQLPFFWSDISVYPGNSGGPVVEGGKLVGVVSKQAIHEGLRIPFGLAIKARLIAALITEQRQKDRE